MYSLCDDLDLLTYTRPYLKAVTCLFGSEPFLADFTSKPCVPGTPHKRDLSTHCVVSSVLPRSAGPTDARVKHRDQIFQVAGRPIRRNGEKASMFSLTT